jgi:2-polyprenyl-3-methyl-5-hydroxy-6-metoxy-1,4-benzoquinol methylase
MEDNLAFALALDLLFNGQNMDYCERPLSLSAMESMPLFMDLKDEAHVCVIGPGGGRLVRTLLDKGYSVDAYEGRKECLDHLQSMFTGHKRVQLFPVSELDDPLKREKKAYNAIFCMDDLRSFREEHDWTTGVQKMIRPRGYFVYSQVSNKLPGKHNPLQKYFKLIGDYNVSEQTAKEIRECYLGLEYWRPKAGDKQMASETLQMIKSASSLRRSIMSGVEVHYVAWQAKK